MNDYWTYILTDKYNKRIYVGVTNDLVRRVYEHKAKEIKGYTKQYNIDKLVYFEHTTDVYNAITREKQIKKWTRAKKNTLIETKNPAWEELVIY